MAGHLFIVRGDLLNVACDAILLPTGVGRGGFGELLPHWSEPRIKQMGRYVKPAPTEKQRTCQVAPFVSLQEPALWAGHTGEDGRSPEWFAQAAADFVLRAARSRRPRGAQRPLGSPRPLLALPLVGTGAGGMSDRKGEVVAAIVNAIDDAQRRADADVALVLANPEGYTAAQRARADLGKRAWRDLTAAQQQTASELAVLARNGQLVLFLGAGTSVGAGLPSWSGLLDDLARRAALRPADRRALHELDPRDAGDLLARQLAAVGSSMRDAICEITERAGRSSLTHQLLASLPVNEAVTTNYDTLFEQAWTDAGRRLRVLPRQDARRASTWLLKLHGSVDDKKRIVLSREDYLRFEGDGSAASGIVQAMLLTRHMLFVGYSLSDDNFHRIVHQVRRGVGPAQQRPTPGTFSTAITPAPLGLSQQLWAEDVSFVSTASGKTADPRRLAILLDRIGAEAAAPAAHLLDESYDALLSPAEVALRDKLRATWEELDTQRDKLPTSVSAAVADALSAIGHPSGTSRTPRRSR